MKSFFVGQAKSASNAEPIETFQNNRSILKFNAQIMNHMKNSQLIALEHPMLSLKSFALKELSLGLVVLAFTLLLGSTAMAQFPPPPPGGGGGGGGHGNGIFDPLDDIEILSLSYNDRTVSISWKLHDDYLPQTDKPLIDLISHDSNSTVNTAKIDNATAKNVTYSRDIEIEWPTVAPEGDFTIFVAYPMDGQTERGIGLDFTITGSNIYPDTIHIVYLGLNPLPFIPLGTTCKTCDPTLDRGAEEGEKIDQEPDDVRLALTLLNGAIAGCSSCGGGQSSTGPQIPTELILDMANLTMVGSAGPGFSSLVDYSAYVVANNQGENVSMRFYLPTAQKLFTLRDDYNASAGNYTGTVDGILEGEHGVFQSVKLVNGGGNLVTQLKDATDILVTKIDGTVLTLKLWDIEQTSGDNDQDFDSYARLSKITGRCGVDTLTLTYANNTTGVPQTVVDRFGNTATYQFNATVAGRPALSKFTYNGQDTTITYANDFINTVTYPNGATWTCTISHDPIAQTRNLVISSPCEPTKTYRYTDDVFFYDDTLINQPINVLRSISDANDDNLWSIYYSPTNASEARIWTTGNQLAHYQNDSHRKRFQYYKSWAFNPSNPNSWNWFTNLVFEDTYMELDYGPFGGSETELVYGAAGSVTIGTDEVVTCGYGPSAHITSRSYEDGSFETWSYDNDFNVTRYRNRNGNVTKYIYDSCGRVIERQVGIVDSSTTPQAPNDSQQPEYAVYKFAYYTSGIAKGMIKTEYTARWNGESDLYRTDYEYDSSGRLEFIYEAAEISGGTRPKTTYTYTSSGQVHTITDPMNRVVTNHYDSWGRAYKTEYNDGSTEITYYGGPGQECLPVKTKARDGAVTQTTYDSLNRVQKMIAGYSTINALGVETLNTDLLTQSVTDYFYVGNSGYVDYQVTDGRKTSFVYDYKGRVVESSAYPNSNTVLTNKTVYRENRVFYTEDPYGRREYMAYSASNTAEPIRRIQCTNTTQTFADYLAVLNASYDTNPNAAYLITDAIKDSEGNVTELIDGRGIKTKMEYDCREREVVQIAAYQTAAAARAETFYDAESNVIEVRTPRYFDVNDSTGHNLARTTYSYNGRGARSAMTEAPGTSVAASTFTTYYLDGRVKLSTDARGNNWFSYYHSCCARPQGNMDPAGHGSITNNDFTGRITHQATVADYASHSNKHDPVNAKTLSESTSRFDLLGRTIASTAWTNPLGNVDPNNAPIAGLDGISATDGITTRTLYDSNLADGIGLDNSSGVSVEKLGGGSFNVSLANAISKLKDNVNVGGADTVFVNGVSSGSGMVTINGQEEISFRISDGAGRNVIAGQIQTHGDPSPNDLIVFGSSKYDQTTTVVGFGSTLETWSIDPNGNVAKSRNDGAGRTLELIDQESNVSTATYDANGNVLSSRDANGVGADLVYDEQNRTTSQTDTWGGAASTSYYLGGMVKSQTDAKGKSNLITYDERGRQKTVTDRLGNDSTFTFDANGNPLTITDAENRVTAYAYDNRNLKTDEIYPDHTGGSPGNTSYGTVQFAHDEAGRVLRKTDQSGATVTFNYDLVGRMFKRDYRTAANSPSGTIADSDTFTFDDAGRTLTADSGRYANTITLTYDMAGRLANESLDIAQQTYTVQRQYDDRGQLFKQVYPDGSTVERTYTPRGRLNTVKYGSNIVDTRTYDASGRLSTSTYQNGIVTTYNYRESGSNKDNLVGSIVTTNSGPQHVGDLSYTYDANKNKTSETITNNSITNKSFNTTSGSDPDGYDDDDRLTYWQRPGKTQQWNLTNVGDWASITENSVTTSRTHSAAHEINSVGSSTLSHDVNGNLTSNPQRNHNYTWDFDNRMASADTDDDSVADVQFEYDALGRRVKKDNTVYSYAGQQVFAEYVSGTASSSPKQKYVYGSYIDEPILKDGEFATGSGIVYYSRNQQFSITCITNGGGNTLERYAYTAYGDVDVFAPGGLPQTGSNYGNSITYTGRRIDSETGLYHFRARTYDSELGRFIGRDPLGYMDGMSLYCGSFSLNYLDPLGLFQESNGKVVSATIDWSRHWAIMRQDGTWDKTGKIFRLGNGWQQQGIGHFVSANLTLKAPTLEIGGLKKISNKNGFPIPTGKISSSIKYKGKTFQYWKKPGDSIAKAISDGHTTSGDGRCVEVIVYRVAMLVKEPISKPKIASFDAGIGPGVGFSIPAEGGFEIAIGGSGFAIPGLTITLDGKGTSPFGGKKMSKANSGLLLAIAGDGRSAIGFFNAHTKLSKMSGPTRGIKPVRHPDRLPPKGRPREGRLGVLTGVGSQFYNHSWDVINGRNSSARPPSQGLPSTHRGANGVPMIRFSPPTFFKETKGK